MSVRDLTQLGWLVTILLQGLWAWRIWRAGHRKRYPAVFAYLVFGSASGAITLGLWVSQIIVGPYLLSLYVHFLFRPITWVLLFAATHEMFRVLAKEYVGLRRLGQLVLYGALGSVGAFLLAVIVANPEAQNELNHYYRLWLIQEQSIYLATALAVITIIVVGRFFSLPMSRNLRVMLGSLGIYFVCMGAFIVSRVFLGSSWNHVLDWAGLGTYCVCLLIGVLAYSPAGDRVAEDPRLTQRQRHLEALGQAHRRLEEVNMHLVRALAK